jgi:hypothetical protein
VPRSAAYDKKRSTATLIKWFNCALKNLSKKLFSLCNVEKAAKVI